MIFFPSLQSSGRWFDVFLPSTVCSPCRHIFRTWCVCARVFRWARYAACTPVCVWSACLLPPPGASPEAENTHRGNEKRERCMFMVQISPWTLITHRYWNSLFQSHLPGENVAQFSAAVAIHVIPIFIPPGTITAGWTEALWIQSLPKAFTHDQRCRNRTPHSLISGPML